MSNGDYSRHTFDPAKNYTGVLMQQGRVQLDADWNELVEIFDHRLRTGIRDMMGDCVVPRAGTSQSAERLESTPGGFEITKSGSGKGSKFAIGSGRIYIEGWLAENPGIPIPRDPRDQGRSKIPDSDPLPYTEQRNHVPDAEGFDLTKPFIFYIDVWQREITYLEDHNLIEQAIGMDTTTRLKTIWQVRRLGLEEGTGFDTLDENEKWKQQTQASAGRLSIKNGSSQAKSTWKENCLYRVEIHNEGPPGTASFKWSRDNGTIASSVTRINGSILTIKQTIQDSFSRFKRGDFVEVIDEFREYAGLPGEIRKIKEVKVNVLTIELDQELTKDDFPTDSEGNVKAERPTRIRRWDGNGIEPVQEVGKSVHIDGIEVEFSLAVANGKFRTGDYWVFAVRPDNGWVEPLANASPRGIRHHYARLAFVDSKGQLTDCRRFWPRPPEIHVERQDSKNGNSLQKHIEDFIESGGGTISLGSGEFHLKSPLIIKDGKSLRLKGQGYQTVLYAPHGAPAIIVINSVGLSIEDLVISKPPPRAVDESSTSPTEVGEVINIGICLVNESEISLMRCNFFRDAGSQSNAWGIAIGLAGPLKKVAVRDCQFAGDSGIRAIPDKDTQTLAEKHKFDSNKLSVDNLLLQNNTFNYKSCCIDYSAAGVQSFLFTNNECLNSEKNRQALVIKVHIAEGGFVAFSGNLVEGISEFDYNEKGFNKGKQALKNDRWNRLRHPVWHSLNLIK